MNDFASVFYPPNGFTFVVRNYGKISMLCVGSKVPLQLTFINKFNSLTSKLTAGLFGFAYARKVLNFSSYLMWIVCQRQVWLSESVTSTLRKLTYLHRVMSETIRQERQFSSRQVWKENPSGRRSFENLKMYIIQWHHCTVRFI